MLQKLPFLFLAASAAFARAAVIQHSPTFGAQNDTVSYHKSTLLKARNYEGDPTHFGWISRWAAVGDSYTAGIGAGGSIIRNPWSKDWKCSRYDRSYPMIVNNFLGRNVQDFQYPACSGARSVQILDQIHNLKGNLDMVLLTAGGNDLCLNSMIKTCVFLPSQSDSSCQTLLDLAQKNIDTILKPNIAALLDGLNEKMNKGSVVVVSLYAEFFNKDQDHCGNSDQWGLFSFLGLLQGLTLTKARRAQFNTLSNNANYAIAEVVDQYSQKAGLNYKITYANWNSWLAQVTPGHYCEEGATDYYPDPNNPNLHFFKPGTMQMDPRTGLKRRSLADAEQAKYTAAAKAIDPYNSILWLSPNPNAEVLHKLDPRAPDPPGCPGDGGIDWTFGWGMPDSLLKHFHPNELGHQTMASFALEAIVDLRAQVLGVESPFRQPIGDEFTCFQKLGSKAYANADSLNNHIAEFCDSVKAPPNTLGWGFEWTYLEGTLDEHTFSVQLDQNTGVFDRDGCHKAFDVIINSCDGNDPANPMNWKFGGRRVDGVYTYELHIKRANRPFPAPQKPSGTCNGDAKVFYSNYELRGAGWSTWDFGQQTLLPSIKGCLGLGVTAWTFDYFDQPDEQGMEWKASFNTPWWVNARCFQNNKVAFAAGGFTNGCGGSDW